MSTATDRGETAGHAPSSPEKLSLADWLAAFKRSFAEFTKDDCIGLAQQIAYSSLLAFFPAMAFLVMGMAAKAPIEIDDGSPIDTSFPGFTELMNGLGAGIGLLNT